MTRRTFSRLAVGVFVFGPQSHGLAELFDHRWNLGIITDQVDLDLNNVLIRFCPRYQLRWVEIRYMNLEGRKAYVYADATPIQLKQIRKQLDDAGVKVSVLDTAIYKIALPGTTPVGEDPAYVDPALTEFNRQMEYLKRASDAAHALGTQRIRIFSFRRVADPVVIFDRVVDELGKAIEVARRQDITLLLENEYDCNIGTSEETAKLFKSISDRRLMQNWDPCNVYEMGEQPYPSGWQQLDHSRVSHIHLKDAAGKDWKPIGSGEIDFPPLLLGLKRANYSGTLSVETRFLNSQRDQYSSSVESMDGLVRLLNGL